MTTSRTEDVLYMMLCARFGTGDVERQYKSFWYPFACDFYIKSRDLYLELNAFWMHGGRWFEDGDEDCASVLDNWRARVLDGVPRYEDAIRTWTVRDVDKRDYARRLGLNYVVLWDDGLRDALRWFDEGCPDGSDWDREYSWLPVDEVREATRSRIATA